MNTNKSFRLILLRHGNTFNPNETAVQIGCKTDLPLTEKGLEQAQQFAAHLQKQALMPSMIYCGSLQRQRQTAQILKDTFKTTILKTHQQALDEIDYGEWEGLTAQEIQAQWPTEYQQWQKQAIWPEKLFHSSFSEHNMILQAWLKELHEMPSKSVVIGVSSNGIIRLILQWIPSLWQKLVEEQKMDTYKVNTGHYCDLTITDSVASINAWNCKP